ncbi:MAG: PEP-CTERM sorting domain-containing protein [Spirulinaceae cyanobacterium]
MKTSHLLASSSLTLLGCSCLIVSPATAQILDLDVISADITTEETNFEFNTLDIPAAGELDPTNLFRFDWDIQAQNTFDFKVLAGFLSFDLFEIDGDEDGEDDFLGNFVFGPPSEDIILAPGQIGRAPCVFPDTCSRRFNIAGSQINPAIDASENGQLEFALRNVRVTASRVPEPGTTAATILALVSGSLLHKKRKGAK